MNDAIRVWKRTMVAAAVLAAMVPAHAGPVNWSQASGGYWDEAQNWTPAAPLELDDVHILTGASAVVEVRSNARVQSLGLGGAASLLVDNDAKLRIDGSFSQAGSGNVAVAGGALQFDGGASIARLGLYQTTSPTPWLSFTAVYSTSAVTVGELDWTTGTFEGSGTTTVTGSTLISGNGSPQLFNGHTLVLQGNTTWARDSNTRIYLGDSSRMVIGTGSTFADQGLTDVAAERQLSYYAGYLDNAGTYVRTGAGTTLLGAQLDNTGTVDVRSGTLKLAGGSSSGLVRSAAGAHLEFTQRSFVVSGTLDSEEDLRITNSGALDVRAGARVSTRGAVRIESGGQLDLAPGAQIQTDTYVIGGLGAYGRVRTSGQFDARNLVIEGGGGVIEGALQVTANTLTVNSSTWLIAPAGSARFTTQGKTFLGGTGSITADGHYTLDLKGDTQWSASAGSITAYEVDWNPGRASLQVVINQGTTFRDEGTRSVNVTRSLAGNPATSGVHNAGTYLRSGVGTTVIGNLDNTGTVQLAGGNLKILGGSNTGTLRVAAGSTAMLGSVWSGFTNTGTLENAGTLVIDGPALLGAGTRYSGGGNIQVRERGTLDIDIGEPLSIGTLTLSGAAQSGDTWYGYAKVTGDVNVSALKLQTGDLRGTGRVTAGSLDWDGGMFGAHNYYGEGGGGTTIVTGAARISTVTGNLGVNAHTLELRGQTTWAAGAGTIAMTTGYADNTLIRNAASGTFIDAGAGDAANSKRLGMQGRYDSPPGFLYGRFDNEGTFERRGLGTTFVSAAFDNSGSLLVKGGSMNFEQRFGSTGRIEIAQGADLTFSSGAADITAGSLHNDGALVIGRYYSGSVPYDAMPSPVVRIGADVAYGGSGTLSVSRATLEFAGTRSLDTLLVRQNSAARLGSGTQVGTLTVEQNSRIASTGDLEVARLDLQGATIGETGSHASTLHAGVVNVTPWGVLVLAGGQTLQVNGRMLWQNSGSDYAPDGYNDIWLYDAEQGTTTLRIAAGARLEDAGLAKADGTRRLGYTFDSYYRNTDPSRGAVIIDGAYERKGLGTTAIGAQVTNRGTIDVRSGILSLRNGLDSNGAITVAKDAELELYNGPAFIDGTLASAGKLTISNTTTLRGSGRLDSTGDLVIRGALNAGAGSTIVARQVDMASDWRLGSARALVVNGTLQTGLLNLASGSVSGTGTVTAERLTWSDAGYAGSIGGFYDYAGRPSGGTTTILGDALIGGAGYRMVGGYNLVLAGRTTWAAPAYEDSSLQAYNGTIKITQGAVFVDEGESAAPNPYGSIRRFVGGFDGGLLHVAGTYERNGLGATAMRNVLNTGTIKLNQGVIEVSEGFDNRGTVELAAGTKLRAAYDLKEFTNAGRLQGNGTIVTAYDRAFINRGTLAPGAALEVGRLTVTGNLKLDNGSVLEIDVAGLDSLDFISVSGLFTAGGKVVLHGLADFVPQVGDEYEIASFSQLAAGSVFGSVDWEGLQPGREIEVIYGSSGIKLRVAAAVPEPSTYALMLLGLLASGVAARRNTHRRN